MISFSEMCRARQEEGSPEGEVKCVSLMSNSRLLVHTNESNPTIFPEMLSLRLAVAS